MDQAATLKLRMAEHVGLRIRVVTPRGFKVRIWLSCLVFRLGAAVLGLPVQIETTTKDV